MFRLDLHIIRGNENCCRSTSQPKWGQSPDIHKPSARRASTSRGPHTTKQIMRSQKRYITRQLYGTIAAKSRRSHPVSTGVGADFGRRKIGIRAPRSTAEVAQSNYWEAAIYTKKFGVWTSRRRVRLR
ncbi:hypothetical protein FEZ60_31725 [Rhodococcus sp. MS16]|nr:hypothetical protein [Rhodococcus sp. MS16]